MPPETRSVPATRRKFTDDFALGDEVCIIRHKHGWHDGEIGGPIVEITEYTCVVEVKDDPSYNGRYDIPKPRDIRLMKKATGPAPKKGAGRHSLRGAR